MLFTLRDGGWRFGKLISKNMEWTIPFVLYGLLRYLFVVYEKGRGDNPTSVVLGDRPLKLTVILWLLTAVVSIYTSPLKY